MTVPVRPGGSRSTDAGVVRPRGRGRAAVAAGKRSTAAQRAYERRQQRAAIQPVGEAADRRRGHFTARIPFVATIIGMLSVGLALTLVLTTRAAEDSYELSAAKAHNQDLMEQRSALERDVREGNSAPELARKATELGMIPAKDVARLVVNADGTVDIVGKPTPAQGAPAAPLNPQPPAQSSAAPRTGNTAAPVPTTRPAAPTTTAPRPGAPLAANQPQLQAQGEQLVPMSRPTPDTGQAGNAGGRG
ncbi:hypothetical protein O4215_24370 [Rhodococcus maanshanensis]|uniref:hypothetical protein n=1 Tax=Rhodococcus maanshanensis TaxID=183556 RepID=UPI0022B462C3|nr:hypothetical protein [Rhodococcus maanshanensis]MCZ4558701.1 hypothetical protein [Rhodococcus maanshanensis]